MNDEITWFEYEFIIGTLKSTRELVKEMFSEQDTTNVDNLIKKLKKLQDERMEATK